MPNCFVIAASKEGRRANGVEHTTIAAFVAPLAILDQRSHIRTHTILRPLRLGRLFLRFRIVDHARIATTAATIGNQQRKKHSFNLNFVRERPFMVGFMFGPTAVNVARCRHQS